MRFVVAAGDHDVVGVAFVEDGVGRHGQDVSVFVLATISTRTRRADRQSRPHFEGDAHVGGDPARIDGGRAGQDLPASASSLPATEDAGGVPSLDALRRPGSPRAATTWSRDGSTTRKITSVADASTMSPGIVATLRDDAGKRARTTVRDSSTAALCDAPSAWASVRRCASASSRLRVLQLLLCRDSMLDQRRQSRRRRLRVFHARLRLLDLGAVWWRVGVKRWNLEPHQQIAGLDGFALGLWQLDDACRLRAP